MDTTINLTDRFLQIKSKHKKTIWIIGGVLFIAGVATGAVISYHLNKQNERRRNHNGMASSFDSGGTENDDHVNEEDERDKRFQQMKKNVEDTFNSKNKKR
ncbi:MAG TPA: hypothetical protein VKG26_08050 [Bacteroidia bacterium]|nr:hypothetical protein [Bacteroidia bacterium]